MSEYANAPGVTIDQGRISDFLSGVYDTKQASKAKAGRDAVKIVLALTAYEMYKRGKKGKK